ncbi:hypothetical protein M0813_25040 [Anaeramoeba flamelloides]|uniref:Uncharacterized protein n=1 Tax=Anaeramoeba flamelloides TaxID=1746091 RepID=A0ABQ8Y418_9EUKA|nr:hypothetical protein M0813_25040 [Anaeramoeba flamelloides]
MTMNKKKTRSEDPNEALLQRGIMLDKLNTKKKTSDFKDFSSYRILGNELELDVLTPNQLPLESLDSVLPRSEKDLKELLIEEGIHFDLLPKIPRNVKFTDFIPNNGTYSIKTKLK